MAQVYKLYRNFKHYFHSGLIIIFSAILLTLFQNCQNSSFCASSDYGCTGSVDPTSVRPTEAPAPAPGPVTPPDDSLSGALRVEDPPLYPMGSLSGNIYTLNVTEGSTFNISPVVKGGTPLVLGGVRTYNYQWQQRRAGSGNAWVNVNHPTATSATLSMLVFPPAEPDFSNNFNEYQLRVQDSLGATQYSRIYRIYSKDIASNCRVPLNSGVNYIWFSEPQRAHAEDLVIINTIYNLYFRYRIDGNNLSNGAPDNRPKYYLAVTHPLVALILNKYKGKAANDPNNIAIHGYSLGTNIAFNATDPACNNGTTCTCKFNKMQVSN